MDLKKLFKVVMKGNSNTIVHCMLKMYTTGSWGKNHFHISNLSHG